VTCVSIYISITILDEDFVDDCDLFMACTILQKQIDCINGKKENIIVPSLAMKQIREQLEQTGSLLNSRTNLHDFIYNILEAQTREQVSAVPISTSSLANNDVEMTASSDSDIDETNVKKPPSSGGNTKALKSVSVDKTLSSCDKGTELSNPCVMCQKQEKRLACIPCGHLVTCASCGQSVRSCPICHRGIEAFVRIYL
jgi:hypothetical protein